MKSITQFIVNNELIVLVSLFLVIIVLMILVLVTDAISRKKNKKNAKELLRDNDLNVTNAFKENLNDEDLDYTEDFSQYKDILVINEDSPIEIKYVEENEELEKTKAQEELKNLKEELIKLEETKTQEIKEKKPEVKEETIEIIDSVSDQQEKDAIISLEQFNKLSDKIYELNEVEQYQDEGNEPISIQELEELYKTKELNKVATMSSEFNLKEETPKFKSSPVISPVYGLSNVEEAVNVSVENTADLDKLSEEIRKTNEFLNMLKELRKNLE